MTQTEWTEILKLHKKWLCNDEDGRMADLRGAMLREADLQGSDLREANLRGADLRGADLREANLRGADLREADLQGANLQEADLQRVDLREANLRGAILREADLSGADLDFAAWPLWCGGTRVIIDDRITRQLLYHLLSCVGASPDVSDEIKYVLLHQDVIAIADEFHQIRLSNIPMIGEIINDQT